MDRDAVILILLAAVIANSLIAGLAFFNLRGRRGDDRSGQPRAQRPAEARDVSGARSEDRGPSVGLPADPADLAGQADQAESPPASPNAGVASMIERIPPAGPIPLGPSGRWVLPPHDDPRAETTIHALVHGRAMGEAEGGSGLDDLIDPVTGLEARLGWAEAFRNEERRLARYHRVSTVLVAELDGLDALAERLGQDAADRLIAPVADAMRRNARDADVLARVDHTRFHALLPETDEIGALNYAERVRGACDMWLEAGAVAVRLVIGWASPPAGGTLADALRLAEERMSDGCRSRAPARLTADL